MASEFESPQSANEAILQNILGANNVLRDPQSRVEAILLSILNEAEYHDDPFSVIETMLLAIKNGETYAQDTNSRNEKILIAKINGETFSGETYSRIEELLKKWTEVSPKPKLDTPVVKADLRGDNYIYWAAVENATSYDIYVDDAFAENYSITPEGYPTLWQMNNEISTAQIAKNDYYNQSGSVFYKTNEQASIAQMQFYRINASIQYQNFLTLQNEFQSQTLANINYYPPNGGWYYRNQNDTTRYPMLAPLIMLITNEIPNSWFEANAVQLGFKNKTGIAGWSELSSGNHTVKIIAKAEGYTDSDPAEIEVAK